MQHNRRPYLKILGGSLALAICLFVGYKISGDNIKLPGLESPQGSLPPKSSPQARPDMPQLVSTTPDTLDEAIVPPAKPVELTFNMPIENIGEFKHRLEPLTTKYEAKLSENRKTVIITPTGSFPVGTTFTLFVTPETKFDNGKRMDHDIIIHFKTVDYRGI